MDEDFKRGAKQIENSALSNHNKKDMSIIQIR